jgi:hypothetical protein
MFRRSIVARRAFRGAIASVEFISLVSFPTQSSATRHLQLRPISLRRLRRMGGYGVAAEALGELNHPPRVQLVESECSDFAADSFPSIAAIGSVLRPSPHRPASLRQRSAHCTFFRPSGAGYALQIRMMRAVGSPAPRDIHPAPDGFIEIAVVRAILREISSLSPTSGRGAVTGPVAFSAISSKAPHKWSNSLSFGNYL